MGRSGQFEITSSYNYVHINVFNRPKLALSISQTSLSEMLGIAESILGNYMFIDLAIISAWFEGQIRK